MGSVKSLTLELGNTRVIVFLVIVAIVLIVGAVFDEMVFTTTFETASAFDGIGINMCFIFAKIKFLYFLFFGLPAEQSQMVLTGCVTDSYLLKISICF